MSLKKKLWLNEVYYCSYSVDVVPSQATTAKVTVLYVVAHPYLRLVLSYDYTAEHTLLEKNQGNVHGAHRNY